MKDNYDNEIEITDIIQEIMQVWFPTNKICHHDDVLHIVRHAYRLGYVAGEKAEIELNEVVRMSLLPRRPEKEPEKTSRQTDIANAIKRWRGG